MPSKYSSIDELPVPKDSKVELVEVPAYKVRDWMWRRRRSKGSGDNDEEGEQERQHPLTRVSRSMLTCPSLPLPQLPQQVAVIKFSGSFAEASFKKHEQLLREAAAKDGEYKLSSNPDEVIVAGGGEGRGWKRERSSYCSCALCTVLEDQCFYVLLALPCAVLLFSLACYERLPPCLLSHLPRLQPALVPALV
jgi:hypothetical protein